MKLLIFGGDPSIDWFGEMVGGVACTFVVIAVVARWAGARWGWRVAALYFGLTGVDSALKLLNGGWSALEWSYHVFWLIVGITVVGLSRKELAHA